MLKGILLVVFGSSILLALAIYSGVVCGVPLKESVQFVATVVAFMAFLTAGLSALFWGIDELR